MPHKFPSHCKNGHLWTDETTRFVRSRSGIRVCILCSRLASKRQRCKPTYQIVQNARQRACYRKNPHMAARQAQRATKRRRDQLDQFRAGKQCARCGEAHSACLDFHHRDPTQKRFEIATGVYRFAVATVEAEILKCDILCSNCHRKLHYDERQAA